MKIGRKAAVNRKRRGANRGTILRIALTGIFAKSLYAAAAVMFLPCVMCIEFSPTEIFGSLMSFAGIKTSAAASRCIFAFFAAVGLFFTVCGCSARFAAECESMYVPGENLAPPENMLTLKNGVRYGVFRIIFALRRACDAVCFFMPTVVAAVLFAAGLFYGMNRFFAVAAIIAFVLIAAAGTVLFLCCGAGKRRGAAVLYASGLASPLTAVRAAAVRRGDVFRALKTELRIVPLYLPAAVPIIRLFVNAKIRKMRGIRIIGEVQCARLSIGDAYLRKTAGEKKPKNPV